MDARETAIGLDFQKLTRGVKKGVEKGTSMS